MSIVFAFLDQKEQPDIEIASETQQRLDCFAIFMSNVSDSGYRYS